MAHHVGEALGPRESAQVDTIPVIGREAEVELLREALDAARRAASFARSSSSRRPGMGKSRLVRELRTLAVGFQVLSAAADPTR